MEIKSNLGMYAEEVVNRTNLYYKEKKDFFIEKRNLPIKVLRHIEPNKCIGQLLQKSSVDYFGSNRGKFFEMEVKQVHDTFKISVIMKHQFSYLNAHIDHSFLLIYFNNSNSFVLISWKNFLNRKKSELTFDDVIKLGGIKLEIVYPGVLLLAEHINLPV